ncbi:MAG: MATE family efflux transporter [bacterium]|nr:MATE family efflux transporter [bacterium]
MSTPSRQPVVPEPPSGFWAVLRQAVAGTEEDFTRGPIGRAVVLLAVPMVLEMAMESIFAICDVFFVSRLGTDAVATVGLTEAMATLVYALAEGMGLAVTAMVARRIGEKNHQGAAVTAVQAIALGIGGSLLIAAPGIVFAPQLLRLMGGSPELVAGGAGYTAVLLGGSVTIFLLFLLNAIFRGAGDAAIAMRVLWIANGVNLVLDPCLIFGLGPFPEMGITGAAVATTIGRGIGVACQLGVLLSGRGRIKLTRARLRIVPAVMLRLVRVSVGGILQFLIGTSSWVALVRIIGLFGSAPVAGYTIAIRLVIFAILPSWGVGNAAATLVGQNLGARQPERAEGSVWKAGLYNVIFLVAVAVVFIAFAETLIRIFATDPTVVGYGVDCLRYVSYGNGFYAYGMVIVQAFNGAGDTRTPTVINFFCYWLFQIPLAYFLAISAGLGPQGVFLAIMIAEAVMTVIGVVVFRRGKWKSREI